MKGIKKIFNLLILVSLCTALYFGISIFYSFLTKYDYFLVKEIDIQGADMVNKKKLEAYCNNLMLNNIFLVKLRKHEEFNSPWVKKVVLEKIYPDKIVLYVYERKPLFRIKEANQCYYLTDDFIKIKSTCENINVEVGGPVSNNQLLAFADIYKHFKEHFDYIELYETYFKAYKGDTLLMGTYDNDFLRNYKTYSEKIALLYKNVERVDLRIDGRIYIKGDLNGA